MRLRCAIKKRGGDYLGTCLEFNLNARGLSQGGCRAALIEGIENLLATVFKLYYEEGESIVPIPVKYYPFRRALFDCWLRVARLVGNGDIKKKFFLIKVQVPEGMALPRSL